MQIRFLGTAAAEGVPALFCDCEVCRKARAEGGRNIRMRCQSVVDDDLLIDFGPDVLLNSIRFGINFRKIENVIITHPHEDHFDINELNCRDKWAIPVLEKGPLKVYGSAETCKMCEEHLPKAIANGRILPVPLRPFEPVKIGKYTVTPLNADHGTEQPFIYIIESGGKAMLYAHDTGFSEEGFRAEGTNDYLVSCGKRFGLISFDCTFGADCGGRTHMGLPDAIRLREFLKEAGAADGNTVCIINHFSHNRNVGYDYLSSVAEKEGFAVAYDGMTAEVN